MASSSSTDAHDKKDEYYGILETGNPTEVKDNYWIWAVNRTNKNSQRPDREGDSKCGKWLIFETWDNMDYTWRTIQKSVKAGDLGFLAKTSTLNTSAG
jgi:hypothetical protein